MHQDCCASWTTPASATLVRKARTVTPTPSVEITSVPALRDTSELPVTRMLTSAHWVKLTLSVVYFQPRNLSVSTFVFSGSCSAKLLSRKLFNDHTCIRNSFIQGTMRAHSFLLLWVSIIVPIIAVNNTLRVIIAVITQSLGFGLASSNNTKPPKSSHRHVFTVKLLLVRSCRYTTAC